MSLLAHINTCKDDDDDDELKLFVRAGPVMHILQQ